MDYIKSWFEIKHYSRRRLIISGLISVIFAVAAGIFTWCNPIYSIGWGLAMLAVLLFPFGFTDNFPFLVRTAMLYGITTLLFILMQQTISCGIHNLSGLLLFMNIMIMYGLTSILWFATANMKVSILSVAAFTYLIAIVDHFVVQARSFEIQLSDLASFGTAMSVASKYEFVLYNETKVGILWGIILVTFVVMTKMPKAKRSVKHAVYSLAPVVIAFICGFIVFNQAFSSALGITDKYWKYRGSELNGFWVSTIYSASATRIVEPDGYESVDSSEVTLEAVLQKDPPSDAVETPTDTPENSVGEKKPHVIVIMNETFSDVHTIAKYFGNEMQTNIPVTPYFDSLSDEASNIIKGHAIASVYGGNTANSEFEFLTGMSMAFLPRSTVAYNFYLNETNSFSIVDIFNEAGYKTVGMHPEDPTNWKRNSIYSYYGFDETYFKPDFGELTKETDWYRGHVSDMAVYEKIISLYEGCKESGESLFTFAVTMQNHGGYTTAGFEPTVKVTDRNKPKVNEYLSCINNSDIALQYLLSYFEHQDEEVIICFYGDHQPSISYLGTGYFNLTDDSTEGQRLAQYVVPYMYWSNNDIDSDVRKVTSINFLSGYLLELAGLEKTDFLELINQINKEIPVLTAAGWIDNSMNFTELSYTSKGLPHQLQLYSSLQYNALFDADNQLTGLFSNSAPEEEVTDETTAGEILETLPEDTTEIVETDIAA
ncbi:MAG: sulfatase-like hydrolase/transferase [Clostridia bacterium]|nr:sulfatase-like hydrolase/transferase [Clostridia bacterium]